MAMGNVFLVDNSWAAHTRANISMIFAMARASTDGRMAASMMETGHKAKCMVRGYLHSLMAAHMKVNTRTTKRMAWAAFGGLMDESTGVNFVMGNSMATACGTTAKILCLESGMKAQKFQSQRWQRRKFIVVTGKSDHRNRPGSPPEAAHIVCTFAVPSGTVPKGGDRLLIASTPIVVPL
mmetsp:Transcript_102709/g.203928  ORF Transcript_102709/g.203928 Transcript_102709/m.203928 type:complete len:180 (-) Transcript_102709:20-559(-)